LNQASDTVIEFIDVCFSYGGNEILHNVKLNIQSNDFVAVVGPNGGGKTTLIKLILGLIKPQRGKILLLNDDPILTRYRTGYVPQSLQYDTRFPVRVRDIVKMGQINERGSGIIKKRNDSKIEEALEKTHSIQLIDKSFSRLSGGERQRVLLAQALVSKPEILLLDEPTANIDTAVEKELFELFKELNKTITFVLVSHNLNVVTRHASHVICVNRTAQMHSTETVLAEQIDSDEGTELSLIMHNARCPVHDPSKLLKSEHNAEKHGHNR